MLQFSATSLALCLYAQKRHSLKNSMSRSREFSPTAHAIFIANLYPVSGHNHLAIQKAAYYHTPPLHLVEHRMAMCSSPI